VIGSGRFRPTDPGLKDICAAHRRYTKSVAFLHVRQSRKPLIDVAYCTEVLAGPIGCSLSNH